MKNRSEFGEFLNARGLWGLGAEVGVAAGENAASILSSWKGSGLFLIDPYDVEECGEYIDPMADVVNTDVMMACRARLDNFKLRAIHLRLNSDRAFKILKGIQLSFVYIDGNHHEPQITKDLENYWKLIKPGGVLCGHDYYNVDLPEYRCEVKDAIDNFLPNHPHDDFFTTQCSSWFILKT